MIGLTALLWFLLRVIPKPSRAAYPCMRATFPLASAFVLYLLGLAASAFAVFKMKKHWQNAGYLTAGAFLILALISGIFVLQAERPYVYANSHYLDVPNQPMGTTHGIFPGRVVWSWNPDATNENCTNDRFGEAYYLPKHANMDVIQSMVDQGVLNLTGQATVGEAWNTLFVSFNEKKGKGSIGYQPGEKIFIKTNGIGATVMSSNDHSVPNVNDYTMARTSPQPVLAILRHLINACGIPQENISVGDPQRDIQNEYWDLWHSEFPNVSYICHKGGEGRIQARTGSQSLMFYSDRGGVLRSGDWSDASKGTPIYDDKFYTVVEQADYMINVGTLKVHERAGVTLLAKNHFGSHARSNALHLHNGLVNPDGLPVADPKREGYGLYRVLVDLMGHEKLGSNTVLFVVDGLWGGPGANVRPVKFQMSPFNNDWPSSIFMSQDQVALESVCFDFLKAEFTSDRHSQTYPQMVGVDDHLHQAADSNNWPAGIQYDPETDGTLLASLGVHEHWNNANDKKYSRNLGTGHGIELIKLDGVTSVSEGDLHGQPADFFLSDNYPNPFNPSTTIDYRISKRLTATLKIYNARGQKIRTLADGLHDAGDYKVRWNGRDDLGREVPSGVYVYQIRAGSFSHARKMTLIR
jgi:hypothetical protein